MSRSKVAITIDTETLAEIDALVERGTFANRSRAIQEALHDKLQRLGRGRLARECALLSPTFEQALAEEGLAEELESWPEY